MLGLEATSVTVPPVPGLELEPDEDATTGGSLRKAVQRGALLQKIKVKKATSEMALSKRLNEWDVL